MAKRRPPRGGPLELLVESPLPIFLLDAQRRVTLANQPLADWVGVALEQIVGAELGYHGSGNQFLSALLGLAPPPGAGGRGRERGTVSVLGRDGRLVHRAADYVPLAASDAGGELPLLVLLGERDLTAVELTAALSDAPPDARWHAELARWRAEQARPLQIDLLLGTSAAVTRTRQQVLAAVRSRVATLVQAATPTEASQLCHAIHNGRSEQTRRIEPRTLLTLDGRLVEPSDLFATLQAAQRQSTPTTLVVEHVDQLALPQQHELAAAAASLPACVHLVASCVLMRTPIAESLSDELAGRFALRVELPPLAERSADLPLLAQAMVERANASGGHQVRGLTAAAVDLLSIYDWPNGISELADVLTHAHALAKGPQIDVAQLPAVLQHAVQHASLPRRGASVLQIDQVLADVQRWLVERALELSVGRKAEAARLLGISRPRLYRLLESLGMLAADDDPPAEPSGDQP